MRKLPRVIKFQNLTEEDRERFICAWKDIGAYVEGYEGGITPFNRGSLPTVSGISVEVRETDGKYTLLRVQKDGKELGDEELFKVTCLDLSAGFASLLQDESYVFEKEEDRVRTAWTAYIKDGGILAEPEKYLTLK